jgi:GntR family transcriptional regulator
MGQLAKTYRLSQIPLYIQVATTLRRRIEEGHWAPGQKISTLEELQDEFEVARVTVRQAVDLLQKEGLVRRQQGKGTFVAEARGDRRWLKLATTWPALIGTIKDNVPKLIPVSDPPPFPRLGPQDGRLAKEYVFLKSVQTRGNRAYALVKVHLAKHVYERAPQSFHRQPALPVVASMKGIEIASAHQTLVIATADPETAGLLKVPLNAPTAECHCVVVDSEGTAIYVGDIIYLGDCIKLDINLLESGGA